MKLKPCPFCNNAPILITMETGAMFESVQCRCGVRGPAFIYKEHAMQGWNQMCRKEDVDELRNLSQEN